MKPLVSYAVATLFLLLAGGLTLQAQRVGDASPQERVLVTAKALAATYDPQSGLFEDTGWWNSANGISALVNTARLLQTHEFDSIFQNTFTAAQTRFPGFRNEFYDDEGWWALAWLDVYSLRGGDQYLRMSESIFADMTGGWSQECGGGIWWKKNERYKNAIANELFLAVATRLAAVTTGAKRSQYRAWTEREGRWFLASGMINASGLVNDGLDGNCHNNGKTTWSYNQGVVLTGFSGWSSPAAPLQTAKRIAGAAESALVDADGILHDPCEPRCGADGVQFKGIFVRNLAALPEAAQPPGTRSFLQTNAAAVWAKARTNGGRFAVNWAGPPVDDGTGSLISALDALNAALQSHP